MKDINFNYYRTDGGKKNRYKIQYDELLKVANIFHWIHELDEFEEPEEAEQQPNPIDDGVDYKTKYEIAMKRIAELEKVIKVEPEVEPEVIVVTKKKQIKAKPITKVKIVEQSENDLEKDLEELSNNILNLI
jgi:hypothetical protein